MKDTQVKVMIDNHNNAVDSAVFEIGKKLNAKNGMIKFNQIFKGKELLKEYDFYNKGMAILKECRAAGYDVKIDCQTNQLKYYGTIES